MIYYSIRGGFNSCNSALTKPTGQRGRFCRKPRKNLVVLCNYIRVNTRLNSHSDCLNRVRVCRHFLWANPRCLCDPPPAVALSSTSGGPSSAVARSGVLLLLLLGPGFIGICIFVKSVRDIDGSKKCGRFVQQIMRGKNCILNIIVYLRNFAYSSIFRMKVHRTNYILFLFLRRDCDL